jgi:ubiquinone/menaquinone biosynthesis C-methylase UbiE
MPNGYYSHAVTQGYDLGFEFSMLGKVTQIRSEMARLTKRLLPQSQGPSVLDLGCGTGRLAQAFLAQGARAVVGLDPSPYLLKLAEERVPEARFEQGIAEDIPYPEQYFDAVGACFLFHELPRDAAERALLEAHRTLKPGGILTFTDPCRDHIWPTSLWSLWKQHGLSALYFHLLASRVYEPYLEDWHGLGDHAAWLNERGFEVLHHEIRVPFEMICARRKA